MDTYMVMPLSEQVCGRHVARVCACGLCVCMRMCVYMGTLTGHLPTDSLVFTAGSLSSHHLRCSLKRVWRKGVDPACTDVVGRGWTWLDVTGRDWT